MEQNKTHGTCPVCGGTKKDEKNQECRNCGGQTMRAMASGYAKLRPDGEPCIHQYSGEYLSRSYRRYTCNHCGDIYDIDSGD